MNLSYNNDFIPSYNIFNINNSSIRGNIGINNNYPKSLIDINGSISIKNNLIISNSLYYNNNLSNIENNDICILHKVNNKINISKLKLNNQNNNNKWVIENNKLVLKLESINTNSIIQYKSDIYNIANDKIKLLINKNIIITHILLFSNNISISKIQKELNQSIVFESSVTEIDNNQNTKLYEILYPLLLSDYLNIINILDSNNNLPNSTVQFFGKYIEEKGSLWLSNNNNKYINKNVSIFSNNNHNYELYIKGNVLSNNIETDYLKSNNVNIDNNINILNTLNTSYIETKKNLNLNSIKLNIGNNKNINNHIIGNTNISNTGIFNIEEDLILKNNLNINTNIYHNISNSSISLNTIDLSYTLYSNYQKQTNQHLYNEPSNNTSILNISNNKTKINCKTYFANKEISLNDNFKNTYNLGIFYNTNITGIINSDKNKIIYKGYLNDGSNIKYNNINIYQNINIDELNSYEANINKLETNNIRFNYNNNINNNIIGSISINSINKLIGNNNNNFEFDLMPINTGNIQDNLSINTIKLPTISNIYNNYSYNTNSIGLLRFNNTHFELNNGNIWYKLKFDNLDNKLVKTTKMYTPILPHHNFNMIINPYEHYNIVFINTSKIRLTKTNVHDHKSFKIKFNKIYLDNNTKIQYSLINVIKEDNNTYTADLVFDKNNNYIRMELLTVLDNYVVLIKLSGYNNLYKIETNHTLYNNTDKIYIINFQIFDYNNNKTSKYIINFNYNNTLNCYTCSLFDNNNYYEITLINLQDNLYKLEQTSTNNNNRFLIIDYELFISANKKISLGLHNLVFDETNQYFTANIISNVNDIFPPNDYYFISNNKLIRNKLYYTIRKKKHLKDNIYEAYLENNIINT